MFGYIRPDKQRISKEFKKEYKQYYCTLCNELDDLFGFLSRFMLSYDMTFVLICLDALTSDGKQVCSRCPFRHKRKICVKVCDSALKYTAFVSYYLFCIKLSDNVNDSKNLIIRLISRLMLFVCQRNKAYNKLKSQYSLMVSELDATIQQLRCVESGVADCEFDEAINCFGSYTRSLSNEYLKHNGIFGGNEAQADAVNTFFYNLGKWIYLVDAIDDFADDRKAARFNLLDLIESPQNEKDIRFADAQRINKALILHKLLTSLISESSQSICWQSHKEIINNVLTYGMDKVVAGVINSKYQYLITLESG